MNALDTALDKFNQAIQELNAQREAHKPQKVDRRSELPPVIRAHIAQQKQLASILEAVADDIHSGSRYPRRTMNMANDIRFDTALFEAQELERLA